MGLVLPERAIDESAHAEGVRRELHVGHESARAEIRRPGNAGNDALVVARWTGVDRSERPGGKILSPSGCEELSVRITEETFRESALPFGAARSCEKHCPRKAECKRRGPHRCRPRRFERS